MSWCTVEDIGGAATIRHVKIAQSVWESYVGRYAFFAPSSSWEISGFAHNNAAGDKWTVSLGFICRSISEIKMYRMQRLQATISNVEVHRRIGEFDRPAGLVSAYPYDMVVTGVRGTASLRDLTVGDDLKAGQSVLRSGEVVLLEADGTAIADDQLILPREIFRAAALTVGRRVIQMERDQQATFDDSTYGGGGIGNRLVDGWIGPLQEFLQ